MLLARLDWRKCTGSIGGHTPARCSCKNPPIFMHDRRYRKYRKMPISLCYIKWKRHSGFTSGIGSAPKFRSNHFFLNVTFWPRLPSFSDIHQRIRELSCGGTDGHADVQTHTGDHNTCSASIQRHANRNVVKPVFVIVDRPFMKHGLDYRSLHWLSNHSLRNRVDLLFASRVQQ